MPRLDPELRLMIYLYWITQSMTFHQVAKAFRNEVSATTVGRVVDWTGLKEF